MARFRPSPLHYALLAFLGAFSVAALLAWQYERNAYLQAQRVATLAAHEYGQRLHERLDFSLSATYALAAVVKQGHGRVENFDTLAQQMLKVYGNGISALQLAPGGVIRQTVPLAGNEAALGHDLLKDPRRTREAFLAVQTRQLTLAGPFPLMQGGLGVVGRLPVFLADAGGREDFWGFTTVLMRVPELLEATHIKNLGELGYRYELWRIHPDNGQRQVIARRDDAPLADPVSDIIEVPNGQWTLSLSPVDGWYSRGNVALAGLLVLGFSLLTGLAAYHLTRLPLVLTREVEARTRDLADANRRLEHEVAEKNRAQEALQQHYDELEATVRLRTAELSALSAHIENVREEEKAAIARDLHDEFGGILTALKMGLSRLDEQCPAAAPQCQDKLRELRDMLDASINVMRRILDHLRPSILDHLGIGAAIHWQAREFTRHNGLDCEVVLFDDELKLDNVFSITLFRVLQEALTNVSRHARASRVTVSLSRNEREITLEVSDDGRGMDPAQGRAAVSHGLRGMRERARRMGGTLNIRSQEGRGTTIELALPLPQSMVA